MLIVSRAESYFVFEESPGPRIGRAANWEQQACLIGAFWQAGNALFQKLLADSIHSMGGGDKSLSIASCICHSCPCWSRYLGVDSNFYWRGGWLLFFVYVCVPVFLVLVCVCLCVYDGLQVNVQLELHCKKHSRRFPARSGVYKAILPHYPDLVHPWGRYIVDHFNISCWLCYVLVSFGC